MRTPADSRPATDRRRRPKAAATATRTPRRAPPRPPARRSASIDRGSFLRLPAAEVLDQLADQALQDHGALCELDLIAALQHLGLAARLERDVLVAEHPGRED